MVTQPLGYFLESSLSRMLNSVIHRSMKQDGVALLAALVLMLGIVMVLGNIFYRHQIDVSQASNAALSDQAFLLALSVERWARQRLSKTEGMDEDTDVDHHGENWAQAVPMLPVEGGLIRGCLLDLQGRINVNNFSVYAEDPDSLETELSTFLGGSIGIASMWRNFLILADFPVTPARMSTIVDWLDSDSELVNQWGAEQPDYDSLPRTVSNTPMSDPTELAAIAGYGVVEVQYLLPYITALPLAGTSPKLLPTTININTAPESILRALGGEFSDAFTAAILDIRDEGGYFESIEALYQDLEGSLPISPGDAAKFWPSTLIDVRSDFFQLYLEVLLGDIELRLKSTIDRRKNKENPVVMAREVFLVPDVVQELKVGAESLTMDESKDGAEKQINSYRIQTACEALGV
ncbi:MAG: hypothetical protein CBC09_00860 [Cellvibrionales bacterium TMED49]|nr:hypothetical protein [Porticoccaceae bacterium]OUU40096.1 MAG: hypothetical protein CBC09_00860 [Cellvibrionales bacterium TMED49]